METSDVKTGSLYKATVTNKLVTIKILGINPQGGWDALNTATGKKIRIKTAQSLKEATGDKEKAPTLPSVSKLVTKPGKDRNAEKSSNTAKRVADSTNKLTILDAACRVLTQRKSDEGPLTCKELIERMARAGYWKSQNGKTPANTLYAALLKEIRAKANDSRFVKAGRGLFDLNLKK